MKKSSGLPAKKDVEKKSKEEDVLQFTQCTKPPQEERSFFDFETLNIHKTKNISFSKKMYRNKVTLVVNTASFWTLTPHYLLLNALVDKYAGRPFQVLGFPSNQFGRQVLLEPFSDWWIMKMLRSCSSFKYKFIIV